MTRCLWPLQTASAKVGSIGRTPATREDLSTSLITRYFRPCDNAPTPQNQSRCACL
jgi:hypothetical protein